jgi:beta-lactamase class A
MRKSNQTLTQQQRRQQLEQQRKQVEALLGAHSSRLSRAAMRNQHPDQVPPTAPLNPLSYHQASPANLEALVTENLHSGAANVDPLKSRGSQSIETPAVPQSSRRQAASKPSHPGYTLFVYATRLLILGVGVGAIAGATLTIWDPASRVSIAPTSKSASTNKAPQVTVTSESAKSTWKLGAEMTPVKQSIQTLMASTTGLTPGMFFLNLDTGAYLDLAGPSTFSAASTIKIPVLVAFFQDIDANKIRLDEMLVMRPELIGSGAGEMQYKSPGSRFSALETATKMITISDNTATNMLIDRLGGATALNQRFKSWGLTTTVIHNPLPDLEGTNTTSPKDLAMLMTLVSQGDLVSMRSRDRLLDIMRRTKTNTLLPQGLGPGATIAHKTGDIGSVVGDAGLIDMPNGQRYVAAVMVKRPHNNAQAKELIRQISRQVYTHLSQPSPNLQANPVSPASSPQP